MCICRTQMQLGMAHKLNNKACQKRIRKYLHENNYYKMRNRKKIHTFFICIWSIVVYLYKVVFVVEREHKKQKKKRVCSVISLRLECSADTPTPAPHAAARKALQRCKLHFHNLWGPIIVCI